MMCDFLYVHFKQSLRNENESLHREVAQLKEQLRREKEASADLAKEMVRKFVMLLDVLLMDL